MIKILFVCHGNICRSPMAMFIMRKLVQDKGLENEFLIESAATSTEEIGNDMYPCAKRKLSEKKIPYARHRARQIRANEYDEWDHIFVWIETICEIFNISFVKIQNRKFISCWMEKMWQILGIQMILRRHIKIFIPVVLSGLTGS